MTHDDGYTSVSVFILILFLSLITLSALYFIQISLKKSSRYDREYTLRQKLDEKAYEVISALKEDPTPDADSRFDPIWEFIKEENRGEFNISLEDISSKFNLNYLRTKMLEQSPLKNRMIQGKTPVDLKLYRGERGFSSDLNSDYANYFSEEDLNDFFTSYSYANFNVTYEDSLKKLYEIRISPEGSHSFLNLVQQHISNKKVADSKDFKNMTASFYEELYPVINTNPLLNVNFAPDLVLESVLNYPYGGETHPQSRTIFEVIQAERSTFEFSKSQLDSLLVLEEDYLRIKEYLGTRTWFWRINLSIDDVILEIVLAVLPPEDKLELEKKFHVILWEHH